ncbi:oxidoreductase [Prochlorococcus marinus]|uniref:NAD dependent epimerase/dehydratase n=1 Tax=Prochlorococcus marinus (strain SARG / CCMP1375 / SS120) TaxID=167539 RepID=Q7VEI3_PROMA|nr:oxidoreductase [Prochlorococcus marinus]AAP99076.1 NAD dependent epimerase/dehydratase [Prochlorococcus marinus subsp. marinus str. CCMP1375]KGG11667.1 Nucleoside-diphosphate-sugar epimerase [Prochlorococcus marinus str. LG]KGG22324.1 Nucleoside-diphosphate-sugar epimerase [Prochlorococcus marinus str. SS2]KGG22661.1 Nucleoside-diphosphate-sugar epimerase [Prochlorococcus marinus str. SS35]KGG32918.1 Nucleoside-diphosphate-sugar epimerase [Prochlorococcus marinus str. SS51]
MIEDVVKHSLSFPSNSKMLIFGGGFTGQHIAKVARQLGANVLCSRRELNKEGADFAFDSSKKVGIPDHILNHVTHVISCIPPTKEGEDPVLNNFSEKLKAIKPNWIGYLSTTGVYGDYKGEWVTEKSFTHPKQKRSIRRLSCEKKWEALGLPVQILRLPGIYGPGRSTLEAVKSQKNLVVNKPGQVFSRVHIDDIAGAVMHLIHLFSSKTSPKIINIADNVPATNVEVMSYAANLLKIPLPPIESFDIACKNMSPMALSFWQENRRVSNHVLCKTLGYQLIHSDYKSGLTDCLKCID